ncbi:hypothetical protein M441DRAFT_439183 [Trichoderma asperellum CBS 433.97]|uniref:Uncharacterized protein n=1 Tax=Trichoderma asperellum (strain ATCC 204424 / CBS 433.97 / NBRC 101777) TaxID=1042311 RepID=A0A2T3Z3Y3_TRIA4|nr:hypothetical protein M441DRAFT_439183 [Trichoderma asperellum CBS 433.97]PTB39513.1 hypothetical protein M441DRAFT_439183 [Trichoderma asperellum CBS 433.97]
MFHVPAGGVKSVIVVQPFLLGFRASSWQRPPMSCDLGCVGEWAGGDSDCGGVVGGRKCGRGRLVACTRGPEIEMRRQEEVASSQYSVRSRGKWTVLFAMDQGDSGRDEENMRRGEVLD